MWAETRGNRSGVRKEKFVARRLVLLLNKAGEEWQEFFSCSHPSLVSPTNALAELKSIMFKKLLDLVSSLRVF